MTTTPQGGHAALVESLHERGLLDDTWRGVWHDVPREYFTPRTVWRQGPAECEPVTTEADRLALIHSDEPVIIQVDDGRPDGPCVATSANSQPSMVARMLSLLTVGPGVRVLEIGTATGYVAALLCRRLGDPLVFSVEIDPGLAQHAMAVLRSAGYRPNLACADGARGWPGEAPFDRLVATCALRRVPYELVRQVAPGGVIVAPLAREFWTGALVRLGVHDDGTASGRFHGGASYMPMRSHRPLHAAAVDDTTVRRHRAQVPPTQLLTPGFAVYAGTRLPGVRLWHAERDGGAQVWAQDEAGSATTGEPDGDIWQYGARDLWREIEHAFHEYAALGRPALTDFGLTVTAESHRVWLHDPDGIIEPTASPA
ncbi:methyltransferase [Streptomyces sp. NPDC013953]|uniref:methyltransferase n=1 Tax=Streptomyces sp. NPDC013953 TaxID=3364868 RepID=UPI003700A535